MSHYEVLDRELSKKLIRAITAEIGRFATNYITSGGLGASYNAGFCTGVKFILDPNFSDIPLAVVRDFFQNSSTGSVFAPRLVIDEKEYILELWSQSRYIIVHTDSWVVLGRIPLNKEEFCPLLKEAWEND